MFPNLKCIKCPEQDGISLDLDDLDTFRCRHCEEEFTTADVQAHIGEWSAVLSWVTRPLTAKETAMTQGLQEVEA